MNSKSSLKAKTFLVLSASLLLALSCSVSLAQSGSSSVRGIVSDPQGRSLGGAIVTLSNTEKNFSRTQTTGEDGGYVFSSIPPDTYQLAVEVTGFKKASITEIQALVDTPASIDVQLEVGDVSETVTVSGAGEAP